MDNLKLSTQLVGSCNCMTKTPEAKYHDELCYYRMLSEKADSTDGLDEKMKKAGMIPLSEMLEKNPLGIFSCHAGVTDLEKFEEWLKMRYKEMLEMQARYDLKEWDKTEDMYEWVIAHTATFSEVLCNFRQATGRGEKGKCVICEKPTSYSINQDSHKDWYCEEHTDQNPCDAKERFRRMVKEDKE